MKKKIIFISIVILLIIVAIICNFSTEKVNNVENVLEIQPEEEISEEQMRQTKIKLYFIDKTSGILISEERNIDSKELIDNPYQYIINLLISGTQDVNLKNAIPEGTKLNSVKLEKGILCVDLSSNFLNSNGTESIYSIVNTMTEFTEVNGVKFTIDGEIKEGLTDIFVRKQ